MSFLTLPLGQTHLLLWHVLHSWWQKIKTRTKNKPDENWYKKQTLKAVIGKEKQKVICRTFVQPRTATHYFYFLRCIPCPPPKGSGPLFSWVSSIELSGAALLGKYAAASFPIRKQTEVADLQVGPASPPELQLTTWLLWLVPLEEMPALEGRH